MEIKLQTAGYLRYCGINLVEQNHNENHGEGKYDSQDKHMQKAAGCWGCWEDNH